MPIKTIKEPIYQTTISFIFDVEKQKVLDYFKDKFHPVDFDAHWKKAGFMLPDHPDYYIVIPNRKPSWTINTIIAHEAFHVTAKALGSKGLELMPASEEAYNYYHTWILQELTDIYNKHQKDKRMKSKPAKSAIKKAINKFAKKDKKDDMKMIKAAMKKAKRK